MPKNSSYISFRCKRYDPKDSSSSLFASSGFFDGRVLHFGFGAEIGLPDIERAWLYYPGVIQIIHKTLVKANGDPEESYVKIPQGPNTAKTLICRVNLAVSRYSAREKQTLQGSQNFASQACPHCSCTLVLTFFTVTPQVYCQYCESLFKSAAAAAGAPPSLTQQQQQQQQPQQPDEEVSSTYYLTPPQKRDKDAATGMHICPRCELFAKPEPFNWTKMPILNVLHPQYHEECICKSCQWDLGRQMSCLNATSLVGIPSALAVSARANKKQTLPKALLQLNQANSLIAVSAHRRGNLEAMKQGLYLYEQMLQSDASMSLPEYSQAAGLRYNIGMAYFLEQDYKRAAMALEHCLQQCSNYRPAALILLLCYEEMLPNTQEQLYELSTLFGQQMDLKEEQQYRGAAEPEPQYHFDPQDPHVYPPQPASGSYYFPQDYQGQETEQSYYEGGEGEGHQQQEYYDEDQQQQQQQQGYYDEDPQQQQQQQGYYYYEDQQHQQGYYGEDQQHQYDQAESQEPEYYYEGDGGADADADADPQQEHYYDPQEQQDDQGYYYHSQGYYQHSRGSARHGRMSQDSGSRGVSGDPEGGGSYNHPQYNHN